MHLSFITFHLLNDMLGHVWSLGALVVDSCVRTKHIDSGNSNKSPDHDVKQETILLEGWLWVTKTGLQHMRETIEQKKVEFRRLEPCKAANMQ